MPVTVRIRDAEGGKGQQAFSGTQLKLIVSGQSMKKTLIEAAFSTVCIPIWQLLVLTTVIGLVLPIATVQSAPAHTAAIMPLDDRLLAKMYEYQTQKDDCKHLNDRLRVVSVSYYGFDRKIHHNGRIIVADIVANSVQTIFNELLKIKFPIGGVDPFKGARLDRVGNDLGVLLDDDYNFAGSFSCRKMLGNGGASIHSLGLAIDINLLQNPCIEIDPDKKVIKRVIPKDGIFHLNRDRIRPGKAVHEGVIDATIIDIFRRNGFNIWGGHWDTPLDYHHFQLPNQLARLLLQMKKADAAELFQLHLKLLKTADYGKDGKDIVDRISEVLKSDPVEKYKANRAAFMKAAHAAVKRSAR
jgi:hypothetical protein